MKGLALSVVLGCLALLGMGGCAQVDEFGQSSLKGAGSTLAQPLTELWAREYQHARLGGVEIRTQDAGLDDGMTRRALDYEAVGSLAGIQRVKTGAVDFAVSEMPLSSAQLREQGLIQVPVALGGIVVATNLPGLNDTPLKLSGDVLADIYLGSIKTWNDPRLSRLNPGVALPSRPIVVVHRADGSGTTYTFTSYLSQISPQWSKQVGQDLEVNWPTGQGAKGSSGIVGAVASTADAIGYVDYVQASRAGLSLASLQSASGDMVAPGKAAFMAAAQAAPWDADKDYQQTLVNVPGKGSYPILATVFVLLPDGSKGRSQKAAPFVAWALDTGRGGERLGYVAIPAQLAAGLKARLQPATTASR